MDTLPVEVAEKIFEQILWENPQDLYRLRLVSKNWKNIIDECTERLLDIWCKKCSDNIEKISLDDIIHTWHPQFSSWQEYCSNKLALPHIARDIYHSRNEFPNLVGQLRLTEVCPVSGIKKPIYLCHAANDQYLAVSVQINQPDEYVTRVVRIYSINDLTNFIKEYSITSYKVDFYTADNRIFVILAEYSINCFRDCRYQRKNILLAEFLANDLLLPSNLRLDMSSSDIDYVITRNQCFTFDTQDKWIRHYQLTQSDFQCNTTLQLPCTDDTLSALIKKIQICNSKLFVSAILLMKLGREYRMVIYQYQFIQQPNGKLLFSDPKLYMQTFMPPQVCSVGSVEFEINFAVDNIPLQNQICDIYAGDFYKWAEKYFQHSSFPSITIYPHHLYLRCEDNDGIIVFRGNLQQLMNYVITNTDPRSRCTVIKCINGLTFGFGNYATYIINTQPKPKFFVFRAQRVFTVEFIP